MSSTPPSPPGTPFGTGNAAILALLGASLTGAADGRGMTGLTSAAAAALGCAGGPAVAPGVPGQTPPWSTLAGVPDEALEHWGLSGLSGLVSGVSA